MQTVIEALREVLGEPDFYKRLTDSNNYSWDYGAMIEYFVAALLLLVVVASVFRLISKLLK